MWKRDESVRRRADSRRLHRSHPHRPPRGPPVPRQEVGQRMEKDIVNIGKSVVIKGELNGSEDLTIEGHVEGTIQLREHVLTIGPNGRIKAQVFAQVGHRARRGDGQRHGQRQGRHPRQRIGRRRHRLAARRDCRGRALPRQRRHAAQGRRARKAPSVKPAAVATPAAAAQPAQAQPQPAAQRVGA